MGKWQTAAEIEQDDSQYWIMYWDEPGENDDHIHSGPYEGPKGLNQAKRICRGLGHTGKDVDWMTGYPPVAFVGLVDAETGTIGCHYNPRFKK